MSPLRHISHIWWRHIRPFFAPQHPELRAAVPRTWMDIDGCIEEFLFACVISFVEKEDGLDDWEGQQPLDPAIFGDTTNPRRDQAAMLREVYEWAKTGRHEAGELAFAARPIRQGVTDMSGDYTEYRRINDEAEAKTERYLKWIVEYRGYMWT
jgi:hypothetical protein